MSWLWSLIMFLIQRSFLSAVFIPQEEFTPQKYVHSSMRGSAEVWYPLCGVRGAYPLIWEIQGQAGPQRKKFLVNIYCNFIVNLDCSLYGHRYNNINYVRVFSPRRQPSFMREMYLGYELWRVLYSERG
jgi:hypothetical protein